ncbi:hypothetical protein BD626DRAFT_504611 [Schizophyllum amplum]|uniref:Uncharacterized protein n=1 Tax=Schizophyllum amplum TaxID=97359 RepID=A0A550C736_9AGAR|nr:hypothetical protein BD626DRAFT_504611 [Auriculariopsis ampla]
MSAQPRPGIRIKERPNSAIFIGGVAGSPAAQSFSTPPHLPDLPEPPSPVSSISSHGSGLPSPPATNSTGSGSTGDPASISIRGKRVLSSPTPSGGGGGGSRGEEESSGSDGGDRRVLNGNNMRAFHAAFSKTTSRAGGDGGGGRHSYHEPDDDGIHDNTYDHDRYIDDEEDNTARLDRRANTRKSSENVSMLLRMKSLNERNQRALEKLTSISRLSSPSPAPRAGTPGRMAAPPPPLGSSTSSSSSSNSSRMTSSTRHRARHSLPSVDQYHESGSETERESMSNSMLSSPTYDDENYTSHSSVSSRSNTRSSPSALSTLSLQPLNSRIHSPMPSRERARTPPPHDSPRKRASMALTSVLDDRDRIDADDADVTQAALAAVASSRRSPTLGRKRQPLPREFRDSPTSAADSSNGGSSSRRGSVAEPDLNRQVSTLELVTPQRMPPRSPKSSRSATVRDSARRHQARGWYSEDMTVPLDEPSVRERRQSQRGGSAESPLVPARLVGEGLRAAGLSNSGAGTVRRVMSMRTEGRGDDIFDSPVDRDGGRQRERRPEWTTPEQRLRSRSRVDDRRDRYATEPSSRAATSLADYAHMRHGDVHDDEEPRTAPLLRNHRSAYPLPPREPSRTRRDHEEVSLNHEYERERPATSMNRYRDSAVERTFSPFGTRRVAPPITPRATGNSQKDKDEPDHARLMWDSVATFESLISRLPSGLGVGGTQTDLAANVSALATLSDRLNGSLKAGASRAVERQIHADLHDGDPSGELSELNRAVGTEFREAVRMSDDQIRAVTGLLLGMGRVIRELGIDGGNHGRSVSLGDENLARRLGRNSVSPDLGGRQSSASRRSWEAVRDRDREREEALLQLQGRESVQSTRRYEIPHSRTGSGPRSSGSGGSDTAPPSTSTRRVYSPKYRDTVGMASFDSQETIQAGYEPSPTPASRTHNLTRSRTLPPIAIPERNPSVSAERTPIGDNGGGSIRRRSTITSADGTPSVERPRPPREPRKASVTSIRTVRAPTKPFPALSTPGSATTALTTHTVTNSPVDRLAFPQSRTPSGRSNGEDREGHASAVFSRPSTVSVNALSGLQQHFDGRRRTLSASSDHADAAAAVADTAPRKEAVTDSERETRRRTLTSRTTRNPVNVHPADRAASFVPSTTRTRERRKTVTEIAWVPS